VAVSQLQIDLLNLSVDALKTLIRRAQLSPSPSGATKLDYVNMLIGQLSAGEIEDLARDLLYAGQTSVSWIRLGDGDPIDVDDLVATIREVVGDDPFSKSLRPNVTRIPKVVEGKIRDDGKIVLIFVVSKPVRAIVSNFQPQMIHEDHFFLAVIRPEHGLVEVRSSHQRATNLANTFLGEMASELEVEQTLVGISIDELDEFKTALGAKLHRYRGKDAEGSPIDIQDLYKAPDCDDLDGEEIFHEQVKGCVPMRVLWVFDYQGDGQVTLQVSLQNGSVWFRSAVPEDVIDHVFEKLRAVKGL
jgi:hypothetical protein